MAYIKTNKDFHKNYAFVPRFEVHVEQIHGPIVPYWADCASAAAAAHRQPMHGPSASERLQALCRRVVALDVI